MDKELAAEIIDRIVSSLETHPAQFQISISIKGSVSEGFNGGIGSISSATGGGPDSTTIGSQSIASAGDPTMHANIDKKVDGETKRLIADLLLISRELRKPDPDKGTLEKVTASLGGWVPDILKTVVAALVTAVVGA
ncbi:hypothetical protein WBQ28_23335 [Pseudomonas syringae pv. syringae]|uniref:hypothetical protein n=1 Tax=Pseudomonas syringae TaxID=317 RepID=UPI003B009EDF